MSYIKILIHGYHADILHENGANLKNFNTKQDFDTLLSLSFICWIVCHYKKDAHIAFSPGSYVQLAGLVWSLDHLSLLHKGTRDRDCDWDPTSSLAREPYSSNGQRIVNYEGYSKNLTLPKWTVALLCRVTIKS